MQKKLLSLAIAGALAVPGVAMADVTSKNSDITIYGKIHASWDYITSDQNSGVDDNDDNTAAFRNSRLGLKGDEELKYGFKGIWQIETQIHTAENELQLRDTFVGLAHDKWGKVTLGRQDTPYKASTNHLDIFKDTVADYNNIIGTHLMNDYDHDGDDTDNDGFKDSDGVTAASADVTAPIMNYNERSANLVMYETPQFYGLKAMVARESYSNPEDDSDDEYQGTSIAAIYDQGPFYASLAYEQWEGQAVGGVIDGSDPAGEGNNGATNRNNTDSFKLGLGYQFNGGDSKVHFVYEDIDHNEDNSIRSRDAMWAGVSHRIGANEIKLAYAHADDSELNTADDDGGADTWSIGLDHHFSKRTKVYALYTHMDNDDNANYGLFKGDNNALDDDSGYDFFYTNPDAGDNIDAFAVGVVHSF
uniref:Outer membrane protein (Porin) n=1 Tax=Candidatus Kentrum sp. FM TaxID=2126340 RepID=A0A450WHK1_9GAMM|nr:MAG: Outer membrane protein (porin) [Candidatus Kentron sp. FM]VFJ68727.1 MAG: Outer membrane protein (porin) [Candidatus Kentron sp. FM]VFK16504.1 MAG: Outer membrane protein (porin) [Candidatus Kentron sp. FM]